MEEKKNEIEPPPKKERTPLQHLQPLMAVQSEQAVTPAVIEKPNVSQELVPFEPHFEDDISDLDLLSALCGIQENVNNTVSTITNVINTMPRAMFANCQIGSINFTINKK